MSDDLVKHLRNSKGWPTLGNAAADRIKELEAQLAEWQAQQQSLWHLVSDIDDALDDLDAGSIRDAVRKLQALRQYLRGK